MIYYVSISRYAFQLSDSFVLVDIFVSDEKFKYPIDVAQVAAVCSGVLNGLWRNLINIKRAQNINMKLQVI